jgi:hypothetical protein
VQLVRRMMGLSAAFALGACALPDMDSFKSIDTSIFRPASVAALRESTVRTITPEDLVDTDGRCGPVVAEDPSQTAVPAIPSGIALEMTECDVVKRAGIAEKVELGTNDRSERTVTLTFIRGARPGVYRFVAGRLITMERGPEPPPTARPARPTKPAPKPKRTT